LPMLEHLELEPAALEELAMLRLRLVGLPPDSAWKYPAELSGGMVKRAALARALALDRGLLFLDEPTSGLDPVSAAAFDELVLYLQKQLRLTIVMITHDLDTIFRTCNRVGVIVDGRMESDTLERIVEHPHPWIQAYFHGERSRARLGAALARRDRTPLHRSARGPQHQAHPAPRDGPQVPGDPLGSLALRCVPGEPPGAGGRGRRPRAAGPPVAVRSEPRGGDRNAR